MLIQNTAYGLAISEVINGQLFEKRYMYWTKRSAISDFKKSRPLDVAKIWKTMKRR